MSSKQSHISVDDNDSILDISEIQNSIEKDDSIFYSSGSAVELSNIQSTAEASESINDSHHSSHSKTDSVKSLWSTDDVSWDGKNYKHHKKNHKILPSDASPFVDCGGVIRYNFERGVDYESPLLVGSRKITGKKGESGYKPSHLIFEPKKGTLACGYDVDNGWFRLSNYSLISGLGNTSQLDASLVSGSHNHINLKLLPSDHQESSNINNKITPSCAIIGGNHNIIENSTCFENSSAIIGSSGVIVKDCDNTVVIGMHAAFGQKPFIGHKESLFARNIYGLQSVHAGPLRHDSQNDATLDVNGNAWIEDDLNVNKHINADSASFNNIVATNGTFHNISISNINYNSHYIEGSSIGSSGSTGMITEFNVLPGDGLNIIYANPIRGDIYINLGTNNNNVFNNNRLITIKDVTLEFSQSSSYNIYIWVPSTVRIENYANSTGCYSLTASTGGAYILNTNGGSVTFRYFLSGIPGSLPTWVIENQFIGNPRINPTKGFTFIPANEDIRARLISNIK